MATGTLLPVDEYLHTVYEPDCEYQDGELVQRNVANHRIVGCRVFFALTFGGTARNGVSFLIRNNGSRFGPANI